MGTKCAACLRDLTEPRAVRHAEMAGAAAIDDAKYAEIEGILERVRKDCDFRSRVGLVMHLKRVTSWFRFHGPDFPELPEVAKRSTPQATIDCYKWTHDFCDFLAKKTWADEVHIDSCAAHRELLREIVALGSR